MWDSLITKQVWNYYFKWENWGLEKLSNFPMVTELLNWESQDWIKVYLILLNYIFFPHSEIATYCKVIFPITFYIGEIFTSVILYTLSSFGLHIG